MSFFTDEFSDHDGQPIELYDFVMQGGDVGAYFFTDFHQNISVLGNLYISLPAIKRSIILVSDIEDSNEITVEMPFNQSLIGELLFRLPPRETQLEIRRYHGDIANVSLIWRGHVASIRIQGRTAVLRVPSLLGQTLETDVPSLAIITLCNHILYDGFCEADRPTFTETRTVDIILDNGFELVLSTLSEDAQEYVGGELIRVSDGERRTITAAAGFSVKLLRPFRNLSVGNSVDVAQGCDHSVATCDSKFDVLNSFGGFPFITPIDVFRFGVNGSGR